MLHRTFILFAFLAFLFGCSKESVVDEKVERAFASSATGTFTAYTSTYYQTCGSIPLMIVRGQGSSPAIGDFRVDYTFCMEDGARMLGTLKSINGDWIEVEIVEETLGSRNEDGSFEVSQIVDVLGGSGQFAGASGGWVNTGKYVFSSVDPPSGSWQFQSEGTIIF